MQQPQPQPALRKATSGATPSATSSAPPPPPRSASSTAAAPPAHLSPSAQCRWSLSDAPPPHLLLQQKVAEVRSLLSDDEARLARLRAKLSAVESKSLPLLLSLTRELSEQTATAVHLRHQLSGVQSSFDAAQLQTAAVYRAQLAEMDAQFDRSLQSVEGCMREAMEATAALRSFEEAEAGLRRRRAELETANGVAEQRHRARLLEMEQRWRGSRRLVRDTEVEVRRRSERSYKARLMQLMRVDYSTIEAELQRMQAVGAREEGVRLQLQGDMDRERRVTEEEREKEREERQQRKGKAEALLRIRQAAHNAREEAGEEQRALAEWRSGERDRRAMEASERRRAGERAEEERAGWQRALSVQRREVQRLRVAVHRLQRLSSANPFHQLSLECLTQALLALSSSPSSSLPPTSALPSAVPSPAPPPPPPPPPPAPSAAVVRSLSHPQRLIVLQLLFQRLHEAEQRRDAAAAASASAPDSASAPPALQPPSAARRDGAEVDEVQWGAGSFFLTQSQAVG